jgi:hypothetical protein
VETKIGKISELEEIEDAMQRMALTLGDIRYLKTARGFENPAILTWPGIALFLWAKNMSWEDLLFHIPVSEGDMASLIVRTADHLRQVTNLKETHMELAATARTSIRLILREPVFLE